MLNLAISSDFLYIFTAKSYFYAECAELDDAVLGQGAAPDQDDLGGTCGEGPEDAILGLRRYDLVLWSLFLS